MGLTQLQQTAIDAWNAGRNVRVVAVPGAGKSRVLLEACRCASVDSLSIILAYNHALCQDTKDKLLEWGLAEQVICMTFHGLATYCTGPTYDDIALSELIDRLERGEAPNKRLCGIGYVLIDETQDFRPSFLPLIRHLLVLRDNVQYMTVGDPNQMLYDYHEEDGASLDYLRTPERFFRSPKEWTSITLDETHRMTPQITEFVNHTFHVQMRSAKPHPGGPVEVHSINIWKMGALIARLLQQENVVECCMLVSRMKGNVPLRAAVNFLSSKNYRLYINGIDGHDPRVKRNKLVVSTWHASKGTQKRMCIVVMDADVDANPAFVALTRAEERLVIIQDEKAPYKPLLRTIEALKKKQGIVVADKATLDLLERIDQIPDASGGFENSKKELVSVDGWRPSGSGRWLHNLVTVEDENQERDLADETEEEDEIVAGLVGDHEDVAEVYKTACLMAAEWQLTKSVRRIIHIKTPVRMTRESQMIAIKQGDDSRFVNPPNAPDDVLLDAKYRARAITILGQADIQPNEWCFLACASRAWNGYHHTLRQLEPFDWMDAERFQMGVDIVTDLIDDDESAVFDTRLTKEIDGTTLHARCDAKTKDCAFTFVWQSTLSHQTRIEAAVLAALHPNCTCMIVNLRDEYVQRIQVRNHVETILARLAERNERRARQNSLVGLDACNS